MKAALIVVAIESLCLGLIMPALPGLIMQLGNMDVATAAATGGLLSAVFALTQFLVGPTRGALSDWHGRKPLLLLSLLAMCLDYIAMSFANAIWILVVAKFLAGLTAATQLIVHSIMADISDNEERAKNFGLIGAAFGIGFIIGPILGGFLAEYADRAPFYAALLFATVNVIITTAFLKETLTQQNRRTFHFRQSNLVGTYARFSKFLQTRQLMLVFLFFQIAFYTYPAVWAYYTIERLGWNAEMIGISLTTYGVGVMLVKGFFVRLVIDRIGLRNTAIAGLLIHVLSFSAYGMFTETWQVFAYFPIAIWGGLAQPALAGMISNTVPEDYQGELQGATTSVIAIAAVTSPLVMTQIFRFSTAEYSLPAAPFFLASLITLLAVIILVLITLNPTAAKDRSTPTADPNN